jgi:hypothetical protein
MFKKFNHFTKCYRIRHPKALLFYFLSLETSGGEEGCNFKLEALLGIRFIVQNAGTSTPRI